MFKEEITYGTTINDLMEAAGISEADEILDDMIAKFGFENPYTISIARMIERGDVSIETLRITVEGLGA